MLLNNPYRFDWEAMIIDWECSQYTKEACPRNARQEMEYIIENSNHVTDYYLIYCLKRYMIPKLNKLGL